MLKRASYAVVIAALLIGGLSWQPWSGQVPGLGADPAEAAPPVVAPKLSVADPVIRTGREQKVLGPSGNIDSVYATVRDASGRLRAYMSNHAMIYYRQSAAGTLSLGRVTMRVGGKGSPDQCGVHPVGGIYKVTRLHWVTFYHGERANPNQYGGRCSDGPGRRNLTRWSIFRMETFDGGLTWRKGREVVRQDQQFVSWSTGPVAATRDDAGSPRLVIHGSYFYLFYRAVNQDSPDAMQMSLARAPKTSLGAPGAWRKFHRGSFSQPGVGGHQSTIAGLPQSARGITWNNYLGSYVTALASRGGLFLYRSAGSDLTHWSRMKQLVGPYATVSAWGKTCIPGKTPDFPAAVGYAATIGWTGSSEVTGRNFWVYYMLKPEGQCFNRRLLVRRQVSLDATLRAYPRTTVTSGRPVYRPGFTHYRKARYGAHGWDVSIRLNRNGDAWPRRKVAIQVWRNHAWRTVKTKTTTGFGNVHLYGYGSGYHRFRVFKSGNWPAVNSVTFKRTRR